MGESILPRIHHLDQLVANQIAAGEVIERPASIVKELIENSADAGATQLEIKIEDAGLRRIQVTDNGHGIHVEDMYLAITRHATSKIKNSTDLLRIETLGFRGEALASISAVAKTTLISKHIQSDKAYQLIFDPLVREQQSLQLIGHPQGTTVIVEDLFYTIPARKHFLKSQRTEWLHIEESVKRFVIARPQVGLRLFHQGKLIANYDRQLSHELKIQRILGGLFSKTAYSIDNHVVGMRIFGWLSQVKDARSQPDMQYVSINGRVIRDKLINHAIRQAYEARLHPGRHASYVLYLECDSAIIDVNVHPTKHEVRFRESRLIYDFVMKSVADVLNLHAHEKIETSCVIDEVETAPISHAHSMLHSEASYLPLIGQLGEQWLFVNMQHQSLVFINVHAAMSVLARDALCAHFKSTSCAVTELLIPHIVTLSVEACRQLLKCQQLSKKIAIDCRCINTTQVAIHALPSVFKYANVQRLLEKLIELSIDEGDNIEIELIEHLPCLAAPNTLRSFSMQDKQSLVQAILSYETAPLCVHGNKAWQSVDAETLLAHIG